jgi:Rps23 Pro-64 3,4-dihydroxylase Tpa1-like proline 4-hydroxylase
VLNPALDLAAAARHFAERGRLQLRDFLAAEFAGRLHGCLERDVPWGLTYTGSPDEAPVLLQQPELEQRSTGELGRAREFAQALSEERFAFHYGTYMMVSAYRERRDPQLLLHAMVEFLNSEEFLGAMRTVTGMNSICKANAQATRYCGGDFLTWHTDGPNPARKAAYVINLTRGWEEEWGGLLQFRDGGVAAVAESYLPLFNSLSLFRVPAWHHVSRVSEAVPHPRYAITGWVLDR